MRLKNIILGCFTSILLLLKFEIFANENANKNLSFFKGSALKYLDVQYSLDCKKIGEKRDFNMIQLLIRYTNISNTPIVFDAGELGLAEKFESNLTLFTNEKSSIYGSDNGLPRDYIVSKDELKKNNADQLPLLILQSNDSIYKRIFINRYYFIDTSINYSAHYEFSFSLSDFNLFWLGGFDFLFDMNCFNDEKILWEKVGGTKGLFFRSKQKQ